MNPTDLLVRGLSAALLIWTPSADAFQAPIIARHPARRAGVLEFGNDRPEVVDYSSPLASPDADMTALDVVKTCMDALMRNDEPMKDAGLEVCYNFSSDRCRASLGGTLENFLVYANNPAFGPLTKAKEYSVLNVGSVIAGTMTRGAMQTVLTKLIPEKGNDRTYLW